MIRIAVNILLLSCLFFECVGQSKFWIKNSFKPNLLKYSLDSDYCSTWLDQCSYLVSNELKIELERDGVQMDPVLLFERKSESITRDLMLGFALEQVGGKSFIDAGLTGKGVKIGVIDGGFLKANTSPNLEHIFGREGVKWYRDYITPNLEPYGGSAPLDDIHGTEVMIFIGGVNSEKKIQFGLATDGEYYLARTDHGAYEKRMEEDLLIKALEDLHEMGVRLVNISLGYAAGYVRPEENYTPEDMDGKTSAISRAVDIAFQEKNMLIIVAAGNEGFDPKWKVLSTPGDAKGALTVGATKLNIWEKMDYSSIGTPSLEYIKPEISCYATQGTSFSTPIITGIAAGIMQFDSTLSASEIKSIIQKSGSYYPYGNDYIGYGVPDCKVILGLLMNGKLPENKAFEITTSRDKVVVKSEYKRNYVVVFHKVDGFKVINREVYRPDNERIKITRYPGASQSTALIDNKITEIFWKK